MPLFNTSIAIEFMGGPFDGHKQVVACWPDELASTVAMPARFAEPGDRGTPSRTVALYQLDRSQPGWYFRHTGWAAAPQPQKRWTSVVSGWYRQISRAATSLLSQGHGYLSRAALLSDKPPF